MAHMLTKDTMHKASERRPPHPRVNELATVRSTASRHEALRGRLGNRGAETLYRRLAERSNEVETAESVAADRGRVETSAPLQITLSQPGDASEREADRMADVVMSMREPTAEFPITSPSGSGASLQRLCEKCEEEFPKGMAPVSRTAMREERLHRASAQDATPSSSTSLSSGIAALRRGGRPLPADTRAFFVPRFGVSFGDVRVHTGMPAEETAKGINAKAFAIGRDIAFAEGQYAPESYLGKRLLAHELTHVVQQNVGAARVQRTIGDGHDLASPRFKRDPDLEGCYDDEARLTMSGKGKGGMRKIEAGRAVKTVQDALVELGYLAPEEATGRYNQATWDAVRKLKKDKRLGWEDMGDVGPGTMAWLDKEFRPVTPVCPPCPSTSPRPPGCPPCGSTPSTCPLPVLIGTGRTGCGTGTDFTHFDFPKISSGAEAKLALWAAAHNKGLPLRSLVTDLECMLEMDGVLAAFAGLAGHAAFSQFAAGSGTTVVHGPGSTLGAMALGCGSFLATLAKVKHNVETQLASQARAGSLNPCALSVIPPTTHFQPSDKLPLKAVIGGTHGEKLFVTKFSGDIFSTTYSIELRFEICDNFGVDESDLYAPGLLPFWVLQHERSASRYKPFINELDLPVTVSGTF
jgi:hypothetical protein